MSYIDYVHSEPMESRRSESIIYWQDTRMVMDKPRLGVMYILAPFIVLLLTNSVAQTSYLTPLYLSFIMYKMQIIYQPPKLIIRIKWNDVYRELSILPGKYHMFSKC